MCGFALESRVPFRGAQGRPPPPAPHRVMPGHPTHRHPHAPAGAAPLPLPPAGPRTPRQPPSHRRPCPPARMPRRGCKDMLSKGGGGGLGVPTNGRGVKFDVPQAKTWDLFFLGGGGLGRQALPPPLMTTAWLSPPCPLCFWRLIARDPPPRPSVHGECFECGLGCLRSSCASFSPQVRRADALQPPKTGSPSAPTVSGFPAFFRLRQQSSVSAGAPSPCVDGLLVAPALNVCLGCGCEGSHSQVQILVRWGHCAFHKDRGVHASPLHTPPPPGGKGAESRCPCLCPDLAMPVGWGVRGSAARPSKRAATQAWANVPLSPTALPPTPTQTPRANDFNQQQQVSHWTPLVHSAQPSATRPLTYPPLRPAPKPARLCLTHPWPHVQLVQRPLREPDQCDGLERRWYLLLAFRSFVKPLPGYSSPQPETDPRMGDLPTPQELCRAINRIPAYISLPRTCPP